jgi:hypothetical protein
MSLGRTIMSGIGVCLGALVAQDCPPVARVLPTGTVAGSLDSSSCQLSDHTPYAPYRLDLPVRGQIKIELSGAAGGFTLTLRDASGIKVDSGAGLLRPIEAGSYTLLVNGSAAGQSGTYTVKTSFTSEPGMQCSNFPNIGRHQTTDGKLPGSTCLAPDGTPYEAYTLTTDGAGTLTVTVTSPDFTPMIAVRSIDGHALSLPSGSPLNVVLAGDSQYLVVISSADKTTGAYQIANTYQPADNETCRSQKTLAPSDSDTNSINAASCFVTIAGSGDQSYYNYYDFTLTEAGLASASAVSGDFTATLVLLDAAGNVLASDTGGGGFDAQSNVQSSLRAQIPAGSYRLQIFSDLPSGGNYSLKSAFQAGNPQPCTAGVLNGGDLLNSALTDASCRTSIGLSDQYTLTLPSAGTVDLEIDSGTFDTILAIRDTKDNVIVRDDEVDGLSVAHITADLPAGVYTVIGAATSGAGKYQLTSKFTAHDIPACTFAQSLDLNGGFIQRLGSRSCTGANGQPVDYYTFTLAADALVLAVMTSSEVDGYLTLYDANGNVVRSDDNTYGSNDPLIVQYLPSGTYKLAARGASSTVGGLYEVDLRTVTGPRPPFCAPKATVTAGATVSGVITYTGCQYADNSFADLYQMDLTADTAIDLRLNSSEFDAYLVLLDSKGAVIDEDDDSGGNTNSLITHRLAAGTYFIVVKPFGEYTSHGAYTLITKSDN